MVEGPLSTGRKIRRRRWRALAAGRAGNGTRREEIWNRSEEK